MACFLLSVSLGNIFVAGVNFFIQNPAPSFEADKAGTYKVELTVSDGTHTVKTVEDIEVVTQVQLEALEASDVEARKAKGKVTNPAVVDAGRDAAIKPAQPSTSLPRPTAVTPKGQPRTPGSSSKKPAASKVDIAPKDRRHTTITPDVAGTYVLKLSTP